MGDRRNITDIDEENKNFVFWHEPTVYVIHENDKWMEPLREAFEKQGIHFVEWHLGKGGVFDFNSIPPEGVFYSRMSASSHTRGHRFGAEHTHAVLEWLELNNRRVINGSRALSLEISKVRQYRALEKVGIKTPRTIVVSSNVEDDKEKFIEDVVGAAQKYFPSTPYLTKHNRSGRGLGVRLFREHHFLRKYMEGFEYEIPVDGITLLQEYLESPDGSVIRCEFIGGKFIYALRINTSDGFENCPADHCSQIQNFKTKFEIIKDFDHPIVAQYEKFLRDNQIEIAGVEFIYDKEGNLWTFDVNTNTNYNLSAEKTAYKRMVGMSEIASFLHRELQQVLGTNLPLEPEPIKHNPVTQLNDEVAFKYPVSILSSIGGMFNNLATAIGLTSG